MSGRPFVSENPSNVCVEFNRDGELRLERQSRPLWKTPPKVNQVLWCEYYSDERWYLHLGRIINEVPPIPTLRVFLEHYRKMPPAEIGQLLAMKNLTLESLDEEIEDPLWHMTWEIKYSPMSLAYDFLWFRDIPNKSPFTEKLLFEQEDGLEVMPRCVSTDDIFCLESLQENLFEEGVAILLAR
jgi:hypothetical protein